MISVISIARFSCAVNSIEHKKKIRAKTEVEDVDSALYRAKNQGKDRVFVYNKWVRLYVVASLAR